MRAYIRFDPEFADRKGAYPDGAVAAFCLTLSYAEHQSRRGYFKPAVLKALLEKRARWIPFLIEHHDLEMRDGLLYMVGWEEWQEGDWKVSERVGRIRARRESAVTGAVTPTVTSTVTPPSERLAVGGSGKQQAVGGRQPEGVRPPRLVWPADNTRRHGGTTSLADSLPVVRR